jgi:hypothetical protein
MSDYKTILIDAMNELIDDISKHKHFLDDMKVSWSVELTDKTSNQYKSIVNEYYLTFRLFKRIPYLEDVLERRISIYQYDLNDRNTNPLELLREAAYQWDYTALVNYFNIDKE